MRNSQRLYPDVKFCCRCKKIKSRTEFNRNKSRPDGINSYCKECNRVYQRQWTKTESAKQSQRRYYGTVKGYLKFAYHRAKARCENMDNDSYQYYHDRGIEFKFKSLQEFRDYVLGEVDDNPCDKELHRIDNDGHYEKGNITFLTTEEHIEAHRKLGGKYPCR